MPRKPPVQGTVVTDEHRDRVADLHARGYGRNAICRELGLSAGTITNICQHAGLTFDRAATKVAVAARKTDAAALRSELELQLLEDAQRLRAQVWQPHEYIDHGGKDFAETRWTQQEPSPVDKLKLMQAAGIAVDRSLRLGDKDDEVEAARSMLVELFTAMGVAVAETDDAA